MANESTNLQGSAPALETQRCATCGAGRNGTYCSSCGQKEFSGRHTMRGLWQSLLQRTIDLDRGVAYTAYNLTVRPGDVIRGFLAGRTVCYTHPVPYFMIAVGLFALVVRLLSGPTGAADSDRWITILVVPFSAAASRLVLWRTGRNFAEHLIALLYIWAQSVVVATVISFGIPLVGNDFAPAYAAMGLVPVLGYFLWAYSRAFLHRPWMGALAGLFVLIAGTAAWAASVLALLTILRN